MARIMLGNDLSGSAVTSQVPASTIIAQEKIVVQCVSGAVNKEKADGSIVAVDPNNTSQTLRSSGGTNYTVTLPDDFGVAAVVDRTAASWRYLSRTGSAKAYGVTDAQALLRVPDLYRIEQVHGSQVTVSASSSSSGTGSVTPTTVAGYVPIGVVGQAISSSSSEVTNPPTPVLAAVHARLDPTTGKVAYSYRAQNDDAAAHSFTPWFFVLYVHN